jgi:hypothetical protein
VAALLGFCFCPNSFPVLQLKKCSLAHAGQARPHIRRQTLIQPGLDVLGRSRTLKNERAPHPLRIDRLPRSVLIQRKLIDRPDAVVTTVVPQHNLGTAPSSNASNL